MTPRLVNTWHKIHTSFWFVPAAMTTVAAALAFAAVQVDEAYAGEFAAVVWLWGGSPDGARDVLSTIASSMITVAGVTFSVTMVALTMAASQFGPRLLRNFIRDTGNQVVLGTFVSTFLYCLLVLRAVRSAPDSLFVPHLAATLGLVLAILAIAVLIYFIHHVASSLQVESLVASIVADLDETIDHLFPENLGERLSDDPERPEQDFPILQQESWPIPAAGSGYVQAVDNENLIELAQQQDIVVRLLRRPGTYVSERMPIMEAWPVDRKDEALGRKLSHMITVGRHRTTTQDVEYPAQQIVSVALRALSPALNDPVTAMICIDWLSNALLRLAGREIPTAYRSDSQGRLRVVTAPVTFSELLDLSFNPIRRAARDHPAVLLRLLEQLHVLAIGVRREDDRHAVLRHAERIHTAARDAQLGGTELARIGQRYRRIRDALGGDHRQWPGEDGGDADSDST